MKDNNVIELKAVEVKYAQVFIEGEGDMVLNKMNNRNTEALVAKQEGRKLAPTPINQWEDVITAIHWLKPLPEKELSTLTKEDYEWLLKNNSPCITAFGLKASMKQAVTRNMIDQYSTKFDNAVNIIADKGLIPIKFTEASIDERLMSPQKGAPVLVHLNHFSGWSADFRIAYTENVYSLEQIVNIINLAGFGIGIGSGRTSGYGRYKVVDVR